MNKKIVAIEYAHDRWYEIGMTEGITEIKEALKNGEMSKIIYYQVFKNGKHYVDVHQFRQIFYVEE